MAATLPLLVSALKPCSSHLSLLFSASQNPSFLSLLKPPLRRCRFGRNLVAAAAFSTSAVQQQRRSSTEPNSESSSSQNVLVPTFQQAIQRLQDYWASVGCAVMQCSNTEVGAGTINPLT